MNVWLCPVKPRSWQIIKKFKVFGAPRRASRIMSKVKPNDLLIFHVLRPVNGIVAVCRVVSQVYEDNESIWGKDRYPLRVRIEVVPDLQRDGRNPIPLSILFGTNSGGEVSVEPFLKNVWITAVSLEQFESVKRISAD